MEPFTACEFSLSEVKFFEGIKKRNILWGKGALVARRSSAFQFYARSSWKGLPNHLPKNYQRYLHIDRVKVMINYRKRLPIHDASNGICMFIAARCGTREGTARNGCAGQRLWGLVSDVRLLINSGLVL